MWISKTIFTCFFLLQVLGNYFVIEKRWVNKSDIIKDVQLITITSCHMQCSNTKKCVTIGFMKDPDLYENDRCFLLKKQKSKCKKEGPNTKLLFVLIDSNDETLHDEVSTLESNDKSCPVDGKEII